MEKVTRLDSKRREAAFAKQKLIADEALLMAQREFRKLAKMPRK